jgi:hypothetical protein
MPMMLDHPTLQEEAEAFDEYDAGECLRCGGRPRSDPRRRRSSIEHERRAFQNGYVGNEGTS